MTKRSGRLYGPWFTFLPSLSGFLKDLVWPEHAVCRACGRVSQGEVLCRSCAEQLRADGTLYAWAREDLAPNLSAWTLRPHTGIARQLVIQLKHQAEACLADVLADLMLPLPAFPVFPPDTVVTWVTMPKSRRRERCIDHGRLLAEAVARRLNLPCRQLLLRRETHSRRQASLNRKQRQKNLQHAFSPAAEISFPVLLVDDVLTTGTTALRCAEALREGGAREISVLTVTRATGSRGV